MKGKWLWLVVVLPFFALAAIGYWLSGLEGPLPAPPTSPPPPAAPAPPVSAKVLFGGRQAASAAGPAVALERTATPVTDGLTRALLDARPKPISRANEPAAPSGQLNEAGRAAVAALEPLVRQCFEDSGSRHLGPQQVRLGFTVEGQGPRGRLGNAEVSAGSIQDPFLHACLLDAVADTEFLAPQGTGSFRLTHPFEYRPGQDAGTGGY